MPPRARNPETRRKQTRNRTLSIWSTKQRWSDRPTSSDLTGSQSTVTPAPWRKPMLFKFWQYFPNSTIATNKSKLLLLHKADTRMWFFSSSFLTDFHINKKKASLLCSKLSTISIVHFLCALWMTKVMNTVTQDINKLVNNGSKVITSSYWLIFWFKILIEKSCFYYTTSVFFIYDTTDFSYNVWSFVLFKFLG